jgi:hypothetical protein
MAGAAAGAPGWLDMAVIAGGGALAGAATATGGGVVDFAHPPTPKATPMAARVSSAEEAFNDIFFLTISFRVQRA